MNREVDTLQEDKQLIDGITNGDSSVLTYIYQTFFPMVLHMVTHNSGEEEDAKDVFQEAIIVLYDKVNKGDFILSSKLKTFIYSVCRRLWLKRLNRQDRQALSIHEEIEETVPVEDDLEVHRNKERQFLLVEQSLTLLGEPCQTIIQDFYLHNLSMQEICEKFGYTNSDNAKTQKYKCLQRLKKLCL